MRILWINNFMLPNYLILTPDGVGSTYLQRALTVYLHSASLDYCNTHELLNGLGLQEDNCVKNGIYNIVKHYQKYALY